MAKKTKHRRRVKSASSVVELIVRRGASGRFQKLKKKTAHLPVKIAWDRRREERRAASEQVDVDKRKSDRRGDPPFTWELSDFVVIQKRRPRR